MLVEIATLLLATGIEVHSHFTHPAHTDVVQLYEAGCRWQPIHEVPFLPKFEFYTCRDAMVTTLLCQRPKNNMRLEEVNGLVCVRLPLDLGARQEYR